MARSEVRRRRRAIHRAECEEEAYSLLINVGDGIVRTRRRIGAGVPDRRCRLAEALGLLYRLGIAGVNRSRRLRRGNGYRRALRRDGGRRDLSAG